MNGVGRLLKDAVQIVHLGREKSHTNSLARHNRVARVALHCDLGRSTARPLPDTRPARELAPWRAMVRVGRSYGGRLGVGAERGAGVSCTAMGTDRSPFNTATSP